MIGLFAGAERSAKRDRLGDALQMPSDHIDFAALARAVDAKLVIGDRGRGGRPPYPTELMIRLLVLRPKNGVRERGQSHIETFETRRCIRGQAYDASGRRRARRRHLASVAEAGGGRSILLAQRPVDALARMVASDASFAAGFMRLGATTGHFRPLPNAKDFA